MDVDAGDGASDDTGDGARESADDGADDGEDGACDVNILITYYGTRPRATFKNFIWNAKYLKYHYYFFFKSIPMGSRL